MQVKIVLRIDLDNSDFDPMVADVRKNVKRIFSLWEDFSEIISDELVLRSQLEYLSEWTVERTQKILDTNGNTIGFAEVSIIEAEPVF